MKRSEIAHIRSLLGSATKADLIALRNDFWDREIELDQASGALTRAEKKLKYGDLKHVAQAVASDRIMRLKVAIKELRRMERIPPKRQHTGLRRDIYRQRRLVVAYAKEAVKDI